MWPLIIFIAKVKIQSEFIKEVDEQVCHPTEKKFT